MKFEISNTYIENIVNDCLVFGIFENQVLSDSLYKLDVVTQGYIKKIVTSGTFTGKINQSLLLYDVPLILSKQVLLIGCGKKDQLSSDNYRKIIINSITYLKNIAVKEAMLFFDELYIDKKNIYWKIKVAIEIIENILYVFDILKTVEKKFVFLKKILFNINKISDITNAKIAIKHGMAIAQGIKNTKDLSNLPPNICNPDYLKLKTQELQRKYSNTISVEFFHEQDLKKLGMNAYLAVGRGSVNKPCMSVIKYFGNKNIEKQDIVFIGKGVTFDSGGISIKQSNRMDEMKYDMTGAAVVYGLMDIISNLQLPINVIGILAGCENMPDGNALRPGDIITTLSGKTVEVLDTDAEGRLILCDILTYVQRFNPDIVIDIATLTGACVVALGHYTSGLLSNNDALANDIILSGNQVNDKVWRLPMFHEYYNDLKSNFADISNIGNRSAGAISAGCFLSNFVGKYRWAHIDIAGTAWHSGKNKGSTGRPVLLLSQFLLNKSHLIIN